MGKQILFFSTLMIATFACGGDSVKKTIPTAEFNTNTIKHSEAIETLQKDSADVINYDVSKERIMGQVEPSKDEWFSPIASQYTSKQGIYLHKEAYESFINMYDAAKAEGVNLKIISAFRSFSHQKSIWEGKWSGTTLVNGKNLSQSKPDASARALEILKYSSMPGTSRHHWGTDMDLNNLTNTYFASGEGKKIYDWLVAHAAQYGFCQVYSHKGTDRPNGYEEEKWHWSYLPVASVYLEAYEQNVGYEHLKGFQGWETAKQIEVIAKYVKGINPGCEGK